MKEEPVAGREAGFTLIEALIAILILIFGLAAVVNLFVVAGSANQVGRHMTASAAQAAEVMETLKAIPFNNLIDNAPPVDNLTPGQIDGNADYEALADDSGAIVVTESQPVTIVDGGGVLNTYAMNRTIAGVGQINVRWEVNVLDDQTRVIRVIAASSAPLLRARSRVDLAAFRTCTAPDMGCPEDP